LLRSNALPAVAADPVHDDGRERPKHNLARTVKLFIGIPSYGGISMQFAACMLTLARTEDLELSLRIGDSYLGKARNELTMDFLNGDCDKMLQIDNDILFTKADVARITSHDVPIVGGVYYKKEANPVVVAEALEKGRKNADENGLLEVKYMGTGFLCVQRQVFEKMIKVYEHEPWFWYIDEGTKEIRYDFWPHGVNTKLHRWLSEDWGFGQRASELGIESYADTKCVLRHFGQAIFPLDLQKELKQPPPGYRFEPAKVGYKLVKAEAAA
jgi:hypothetical protein